MLKDKVEICFPEGDAEIDLLTLPFKSTYRVLSWRGNANGGTLAPDFDLLDVQGKFLVLKSFKVFSYYQGAAVDLFVSDGITVNAETVPNDARIERLFDYFPVGTTVNLLINGGPVNLFNAIFSLDIDLQNIYYKYPEKIQDLVLSMNSAIVLNINTGALGTPSVKVNMEVYLI